MNSGKNIQVSSLQKNKNNTSGSGSSMKLNKHQNSARSSGGNMVDGMLTRKKSKSDEDPLSKLVATFGERTDNSFMAGYNAMQQNFDIQNRPSFNQQISDPTLGMGANRSGSPQFKQMNSVN